MLQQNHNQAVAETVDDGSLNNSHPLETKYFYLGQSLLFTADKDSNKGTEKILTPSRQIATILMSLTD